MTRFTYLGGIALLALATLGLSVALSPWWWLAAGPLLALTGLGVYDLLQ
ncbi:MAG: hypothetical protein QOI75_343, partial [Pseudonocardiales bacterium]|nr:hypothetical protein [Pseudonocardiales bacterium]